MSRLTDVIVVGGGTSGVVLAARLSKNPSRRVLLIEAGPDSTPYPKVISDSDGAFKIVLKHHYCRGIKHTQRGFKAKNPYIYGEIMGGTSAVNFMAAIRGQPEDYDNWEAMGCEGWGWKDVKESFKSIETDQDFGGTDIHGAGGPLKLKRWTHKTFAPIHTAVLEGAIEMGVPYSEDVNDRSKLPGVGAFPGTFYGEGEKRQTVSDAYLTTEVRARKNLQILTDTRVAKLIINQNRVEGVLTEKGERYTAGEVVLSCGAFESPKLLMLSGIGPADTLQDAGIQVIQHLPGVGGNLQDHVGLSFIYWTKGRNRLVGSPAQVVWIGDSHGGNNIDFHILSIPIPNFPISTLMAYPLQPCTGGTLRLNPKKPSGFPLLETNFLTDLQDLETLTRITKIILNWEQTQACKRIGAKRIMPRPAPTTIARTRQAVRKISGNYGHQVGTCAMGPDRDPMAVLDTRCRVRGVNGLRVVDAAAMPKIIRGNTYLCCVMFAERVARFMNDEGVMSSP